MNPKKETYDPPPPLPRHEAPNMRYAPAAAAPMNGKFRLTPALILELHPAAWTFRTGCVWLEVPTCHGGDIRKGKHQRPGPHLVAGLVQEMCDYINNNWGANPVARRRHRESAAN